MRSMKASLVIAALALSALPAKSEWIVNTGPGVPGVNTLLFNRDGRYQHFAASFSVLSDTSIASVEGWVGSGGTGQFEIQVLGGASPAGSPLYTSMVSASAPGTDWLGATGLNWAVSAGDYVVAFIAQPGFYGSMPGPQTSPLGDEWFYTNVSLEWRYYPSLDIGVRIAAVPEPASFVLLALGCLVVGGFAHSSGRVQPVRANAA